jgi:DNA-binding NarL/FixJ family response regulator
MDRQIRGSSGPLYSSRMVKRVGAVLARREETIAGAMEAGADGFLAKDASSRQVAGPSAPLVEGTASVVAEADLDPRTVPATCNSEPLFSTV